MNTDAGECMRLVAGEWRASTTPITRAQVLSGAADLLRERSGPIAAGLDAAVFSRRLEESGGFVEKAEVARVPGIRPTSVRDVHRQFSGARDSGSPFEEQGLDVCSPPGG